MPGTFSRVKTWSTGETLTASDLNAEFDNLITYATPAGADDASADATAMQATTDPYPAGSPSLATSLLGELQRIRYLIKQITGEAQWYIDPDASIASIAAGGYSFAAGTKAWFYQNTAPTSWTIDGTPADAVLSVKGGSNAYNANGGTQAGTWDLTGLNTGAVTLSAAQSGLPAHTHAMGLDGNTASNTSTYFTMGHTTFNSVSQVTGAVTGGAAAASASHAHTIAAAATWRPLAQIGIICTKD